MFDAAHDENLANIEGLLEPASTFVDLGANDGSLTERLARIVGAAEVHGVEIVEEQAQIAAERGIKVAQADLNGALPYEDATFEAVCSNQVIEHLVAADRFVDEIRRILKPGGYAVVSTENLASWHNVGALLMGWQPFSLSNIHGLGGLGNPLALHRGERGHWKSWEHVRVYAYRGLHELFTSHGFVVERVLGAGYFPLPASLGRRDARHAMFITLKARRPGREP